MNSNVFFLFKSVFNDIMELNSPAFYNKFNNKNDVCFGIEIC